MICLIVFTIVHSDSLSLSLNPPLLQAQELTFEEFLTTAVQTIEGVTSNSQAQTFIRVTMGPFIQANPNLQIRNRPRKKIPLPESLTQKMVGLATEVATWQFTVELDKQLQDGGKSLTSNLPHTSKAHLTWLKNASTQPQLHRVIHLTEIYLELDKIQETPDIPLPHFANYAHYLHQQYATWTNGNPAWITIAEKDGAQGITQRLHEYWKFESSNGSANQESYAARYLHQHYLPLHQAFLHTALVRLQMKTERHARAIWFELRKWQKDQKRERGLMRLCGTWQWLIHNHQNHGDHKTVMTYPPPSQYDRMDPKPAKIHVQGDTVYIRWEFPRGIIQEESLLLSEKDRALSGSFVNNMGPNGNITARRLKPCQNK